MRLLCGDCIKVMRDFEPESIDLVVTSPPYDKLRTYNNQPPFSFLKFTQVAAELTRILKRGGVIVWVVNDATIKGSETGTSFRQALFFKDHCGLNIHDTMIYEKSGCPFPETNRYYPSFEYMLVFSKGKPAASNLLADRKNAYSGQKTAKSRGERQRDGSIRGNAAWRKGSDKKIKEVGVRFNVWRYSTGRGNSTSDEIAFQHPAIFPEKLAIDHVKSWSNPGDTVLDPMMGSGTVGKACMELDRKFIGIELDPEYFQIAKKRLGIKSEEGVA